MGDSCGRATESSTAVDAFLTLQIAAEVVAALADDDAAHQFTPLGATSDYSRTMFDLSLVALTLTFQEALDHLDCDLGAALSANSIAQDAAAASGRFARPSFHGAASLRPGVLRAR